MRKITEREGKREWKYTQKTNRNIKLLSPTKSLCSIVQHTHREGRDRNRAKVSSSLKRVYESLSALSADKLLAFFFFFFFFFEGGGASFLQAMYLRRDRGTTVERGGQWVVLMFFKASDINRRREKMRLFIFFERVKTQIFHIATDLCLKYFSSCCLLKTY